MTGKRKISIKGKAPGKDASDSSAAKASPSKGATRKKAPSTKRAPKAEPKKKLSKRQAARARAEAATKGMEVGTVEKWVEKINKMQKFKGTAQVGFASQHRTPYHLRRPTGIMSLDLALGGGFHAGGSAEIHGPESVGKTSLAYCVAGMVQKIYGHAANILLGCTEIRPDKSFARKNGFCIGYSPEEVDFYESHRIKKGLPPFTKEERQDLLYTIGSVVDPRAPTGDVTLDIIYEALRDRLFHLVLIDSLGALLTPDQEAGDTGDRSVGGSSMIVTTFMNKSYPLFVLDGADGSMLETTVIGINQARAEIGGSPKGPRTHAASGAYAWKHAQLVSLELHKSSLIRGSENGPPIGREVRWKIMKGKAGTHDGLSGSYNYFHVPEGEPVFWKDVLENQSEWGIDKITDLVETAAKLKVIEQAGAWLTWKEDGQQIIKAQGAANFAESLVNDEELEQKLRDMCLDAANLPISYK
jgi:RecA/RadA recombinase